MLLLSLQKILIIKYTCLISSNIDDTRQYLIIEIQADESNSAQLCRGTKFLYQIQRVSAEFKLYYNRNFK